MTSVKRGVLSIILSVRLTIVFVSLTAEITIVDILLHDCNSLQLSITSINLFLESVSFKISEFMKKDSTIFLVHRDNYKVFTMCLIPQKKITKNDLF